MIYLLIYILALVYYNAIDNSRRDFILFFFCFILISLIPAFQYNIGTDYFSYRRIFENENILEYYYNINEIFFFYFVKIIKTITNDTNVFFFCIALFQSFLINLIFYKLKIKGYKIAIVFFMFFCVTNLMNTQMNIIRASIAIYFFVLSVIYRYDEKYVKSILCIVCAVFFHQSAIFMIPILMIPLKAHRLLLKHGFLFFILLILLSQLDIIGFASKLIEVTVPKYMVYIDSVNTENPISIINILSKMYYLPAFFFFLYLIKEKKINLSNIGVALCGIWLLTCNFYLYIEQMALFSRINVYFLFFYIFPLYYVFEYLRKFSYCQVVFLLYIILPYILKVCFFPVAEFRFETYLF
ncbi:EpsG family protein [Photobacterium leiognathi]|uniref:EpsG family protein n=1 Tax=Photobacterium leiognathi TaxID=553611 RepID=UPI00076AA4D8|nr:EpsG family protein [Photobacterium leiognathi]